MSSARSFYSTDRIPEAIAEYEKSIAIDPRFGFAFNVLGYAYAGMGDFAKAVQSFERYAELNPGLPNPVDSIAEMNLFMGNLDEAAAKYQEALAMKPDFFTPARTGLRLCPQGGLRRGRALGRGVPQEGADALGQIGGTLPEEYLRLFPRPAGPVARRLPLSFETRPSSSSFPWSRAGGLVMGFLYADRGNSTNPGRRFRAGLIITKRTSRHAEAILPPSRVAISVGLNSGKGRLEAAQAYLAEVENVLPGLYPADREEIDISFTAPPGRGGVGREFGGKAITIGEKIVFGILQSVNSDIVASYNVPFLKDVLARAYWKKGDLDKAIAEYERLTTIDPKNRLRFSFLRFITIGWTVLERRAKRTRPASSTKNSSSTGPTPTRVPELKDARARVTGLK